MNTTEITPAEVFPPGEFIREELEARGWSQADLAEILGRPPRLICELVAGKRAVTPETARGLALAFGTSAELWMNLESSYRLANLRDADPDVARRALLFAKVPVKDLVRRGWVREGRNAEELERGIQDFLEVRSLDEQPRICATGSDSNDADGWTGAQIAWLMRAKHLARSVQVPRFKPGNLDGILVKLRPLLASETGVREVTPLLAAAGVRLVIVEPLPRTRIDGACLWLDDRDPVLALSLRLDRIDWFWITLLHEFGHVARAQGKAQPAKLDVELVGERSVPASNRPEAEPAADSFAREFLADPKVVEEFVAKLHGRCTAHDVAALAERLGVHPGIAVGELQRWTVVPATRFRKCLAKVRERVVHSTPTDGWGIVPTR